MHKNQSQGELFNYDEILFKGINPFQDLLMSSNLIQEWQERVFSHQFKLFNSKPIQEAQCSLLPQFTNKQIEKFNPLKLTPLPLNFWKWSSPPLRGPAIYVVMDCPKQIDGHLVLYIGETIASEKRWKGEHDCKNYISRYCEALQKAGLKSQLSIRFWVDVPQRTKQRRTLEQELIQQWLPPFNKETRALWETPFTNEIK